ncbi:putative pyridoxamine 5'-phosphate oxidase-related FMN-binding [Paratrimastix pyriformis]|uniref:Pyridoxamine 5'-phosphate oxidase-related FMN-binding n=1 Tax=Paratrimastix pyriformis TaxID=342808 RepID=A0ABQ8UMU6_9EUKA|nr:putative pyridoxamine 5'-phosphate oxidase-related FMN-binding [Paratrimastix pyriformis]|eukprot:GAFH01004203.1.p1 GENE.GAFH01004203.1~~GAFH01004203.1.p1  ORF type:complete len:232 (-),score=58.00 GAFH01004203.1:127-768(-)
MHARRADREIVDPVQLTAILRHEVLLHLGLLTPEGNPYVVPLNYGLSEDGKTLYLHGASAGKKLDCIRHHSQVSFDVTQRRRLAVQVDPYCRSTTKFTSVMGAGEATRLTDPAEKMEAFSVIMAHIMTYEGLLKEPVVPGGGDLVLTTGPQAGPLPDPVAAGYRQAEERFRAQLAHVRATLPGQTGMEGVVAQTAIMRIALTQLTGKTNGHFD